MKESQSLSEEQESISQDFPFRFVKSEAEMMRCI